MVRHALRAIVIGSPSTDEISTELLIAKVVLKLLERALHEKWRDRMNDWYKTLHCYPGSYAHHRLFHNSQVQDSFRKGFIVLIEETVTYFGQHHHEPLIVGH